MYPEQDSCRFYLGTDIELAVGVGGSFLLLEQPEDLDLGNQTRQRTVQKHGAVPAMSVRTVDVLAVFYGVRQPLYLYVHKYTYMVAKDVALGLSTMLARDAAGPFKTTATAQWPPVPVDATCSAAMEWQEAEKAP